MSYLNDMDDPPVPKLPTAPSSTSESADHGRGAYFTGQNGRAMVRFQTERDIALTVANEFGMSGFLVVDAEDWFKQMRRLERVMESSPNYQVTAHEYWENGPSVLISGVAYGQAWTYPVLQAVWQDALIALDGENKKMRAAQALFENAARTQFAP